MHRRWENPGERSGLGLVIFLMIFLFVAAIGSEIWLYEKCDAGSTAACILLLNN